MRSSTRQTGGCGSALAQTFGDAAISNTTVRCAAALINVWNCRAIAPELTAEDGAYWFWKKCRICHDCGCERSGGEDASKGNSSVKSIGVGGSRAPESDDHPIESSTRFGSRQG